MMILSKKSVVIVFVGILLSSAVFAETIPNQWLVKWENPTLTPAKAQEELRQEIQSQLGVLQKSLRPRSVIRGLESIHLVTENLSWYLVRFSPEISKKTQRTLFQNLITRQGSPADFEPNQKVRKLSVMDPDFSKEWWIQNTGQVDPPLPDQHNPPSGTPGADLDVVPLWEKGIFGSPDVLVAVIDTGVDVTQPDLQAAIFVNKGEAGPLSKNKKDDDGNGKIDDWQGWNFISSNNNPFDDDSHGTHVSGIIAAQHNSVGIAGIAPGIKILPVKFLDAQGNGTLDGAIAAIDYASKMNAKILNNSWGGVDYSKALEDVIRLAGDRGSLFVAASGNENQNIDVTPVYPAAYALPNVLSVGATTSRDHFTFFSNIGMKRVHVTAPGMHIYSSLPNRSWGYMSGTSMACPAAVGVAALVLSEYPRSTYIEVKQRLIQSSDLIPALYRGSQSWGRLNAWRAVFGPLNGQPNSDLLPWKVRDYSMESPHPYLPNSSIRYKIEIPGAKAIRIHFTDFYVEESFDTLKLLDESGKEIQDFYGTKRDFWSLPVRSSTVYVELLSDDSNEKYGFKIDKVNVADSDAWPIDEP